MEIEVDAKKAEEIKSEIKKDDASMSDDSDSEEPSD